MMKKIPGLNDLRIFEVAGRLQNFRQAAQELHLTHSAISHRIKSLEDQLGLILFERQNGVQLTDAGRELHRSVTKCLSELSDSISAITKHHASENSVVRISVLPSFAAYWLLPRLKDFYAAHPEIRLQILASVELAEIGERGADIAIRFGDGNWANLHAQAWMNEFYYLVASPDYLREHCITQAKDISEQVLLQHAHTMGAGGSWLQLFKKLSLAPHTDVRQVSFDDSNLVIQAAAHGHGIAFERHSLVAGRIEAKALSRLLDIGMRSASQYYLVTDPEHRSHPATQKVLAWLEKEGRAFSLKHQDELDRLNWL